VRHQAARLLGSNDAVRVLGQYDGAIDEGTEEVSSFACGGRIGSEMVAMSIIGPTARISENKARYLEILHSTTKSVF